MLCNIYGRLVTLISFVFVLYVFLNNHITCFYLIDKQSSVSTDNSMNYSTLYIFMGARGGAVVEVLRYKPEGRGFKFPMVSLEMPPNTDYAHNKHN